MNVIVGKFSCEGGALVVCDTAPNPEMAAESASKDGSQCIHVPVRKGRYRVEYVPGEDGPDSIPREVLLCHESAKGASRAPWAQLRLQVDGGRIAVVAREKIADPEICRDLVYEASDTIQHDCGLVISTWGDGEYKIFTREEAGSTVLVRIVLDDEGEGEESAAEDSGGLRDG